MHSPTALIFPARDTGNLTVRPNSTVSEVLMDRPDQRASGVRVIDSQTKEVLDFTARVVISRPRRSNRRACCCCRSRASRPRTASANSSGAVGHYFCEHVMGPGASGMMPTLRGKADHERRRAAAEHLHRAVPQHHRQASGLHPRLRIQGGSGSAEYPAHAHTTPGFGAAFKKTVRANYPAPINFTAVRRGARSPREPGRARPAVKDAWGIPVLRFNYRFGDNELKMAKDMADTAEEMLEAAGAEDIRVTQRHPHRRLVDPRAGHGPDGEGPEDLGHQPFGQTHDVKNLFVVDGSIFVSASCQNPTWTILARAPRPREYRNPTNQTGPRVSRGAGGKPSPSPGPTAEKQGGRWTGGTRERRTTTRSCKSARTRSPTRSTGFTGSSPSAFIPTTRKAATPTGSIRSTRRTRS